MHGRIPYVTIVGYIIMSPTLIKTIVDHVTMHIPCTFYLSFNMHHVRTSSAYHNFMIIIAIV